MSKSSSLRRIQADIRELARQPSDRYHAAPLEDDMFEWHFTIRGADDTEFEGGVYHGRILLPPEYPFKPPHIVFLTPSGRFETNTKVCLSFSAYHPELWQPAWGIRLILEALISFLPAPADGAIGALDWSKEERKKLAKKSVDFVCRNCGNCANLLPKLGSISNAKSAKISQDVQKLHELQFANEGSKQKTAKPACVPCDSQDTETTDKNSDEEKITTADIAPNTHVENTDTTTTDLKTPDSTADTSETQKEVYETTPSISTQEEEIPAPAEAPAQTHQDMQITWLSDPLLHGSIVTFAAIVFLLLRKVDSLLEELQLLDESEYN